MRAIASKLGVAEHRSAHRESVAHDILDRSNEDVAGLIESHRHENPCLKRATRVRANVTRADLVDRRPAPGPSLAEHLSHQLHTGSDDPRTLVFAEWIVWNLDAHGYLREDLADLGARAGADVSDLEKALAVVQSLEPTGVGARSLQECLLLQLKAQPDPDPVALELVEGHLTALAEKRYDDLALLLRQPRERVEQAVREIRRLEPRPGRAFGNGPVQMVRPEVAIEKFGDGYQVIMHNYPVLPIRVSRQRWAEAAVAAGETRRYLASRLRAAGHMVTALAWQRETVRNVVQSIIRRQPDFLEHGPDHMRPLLLRHVARDIGVHKSTVSRTIAHRYVDTPHGVFPLRSFFTNRLPGDPAGVVSSMTARKRIRDTVDAEDRTRPLADRQIAQILEIAGIRISRRTVVKYREQLGIAAAPLRRTVSTYVGGRAW